MKRTRWARQTFQHGAKETANKWWTGSDKDLVGHECQHGISRVCKKLVSREFRAVYGKRSKNVNSGTYL